jgi:hypothetical protein
LNVICPTERRALSIQHRQERHALRGRKTPAGQDTDIGPADLIGRRDQPRPAYPASPMISTAARVESPLSGSETACGTPTPTRQRGGVHRGTTAPAKAAGVNTDPARTALTLGVCRLALA